MQLPIGAGVRVATNVERDAPPRSDEQLAEFALALDLNPARDLPLVLAIDASI